MEILIPGLILVAFMVYFSTRLKKKTAAAFERETIETDEFLIVKPDGFLNRIGFDSGYEIDAYSKEFGIGHEANGRKALITLTKHDDLSMTEVAQNARSQMSSIFNTQESDEMTTVSGMIEIDGLDYNVEHKIFSTRRGMFDLKMCVLPQYEAEFGDAFTEIAESFEIK